VRVLAVDLGAKRIGIAVGESGPGIVSSRPVIAAAGKLLVDAEAVAIAARREQAAAVVVGLPLEPDGAEGRMAQVCRRFAGMLEARGLRVALVDERLTSVEADAVMENSDLTAAQKRRRRDGEAACRILERAFAEEVFGAA
jgi:putative holliday junction resolvase